MRLGLDLSLGPRRVSGGTPTPTPTPTPAPAFSVSPSISPSSGLVGDTFTASDGTASNTTGYTRRWLLSGTAIGTGTTVTPASAGSLVLEVTATGAGGSTVANSSAVTVSAGPSYDADALSLFAAMTVQPNDTDKGLYNDFIVGLKADGVWARPGWITIFAAHDAQAARLNIKAPSKSYSAANSPAFTVNRGFSGDGVSSYLTMGEALTADGNYALDNSSAGVWCNLQGSATGLRPQFGKIGSGNPATIIRGHDTAGSNESYVMNDATASVARASTGSRTGFRVVSRPSAGVKRSYFNGVPTSNLAVSATGISATAHGILRHDNIYTDDRIAAAFSGAALSDAEVEALYNRLNTFLTAKGAN